MVKLKIYIAGKISGSTYDECVTYFHEAKKTLEVMGYEVFSPLTAKEYLRTEYQNRELPTEGYTYPASTNHAIFERDQWCVRNSDIVFVNLLNADQKVSVGCMMELAWASLLSKHTIVVMQKDNIHRHAFVMEAADIIFETMDEAWLYLGKLPTQTG